MSRTKTNGGAFPLEAVYGRMDPHGPGPTPAEVFERWKVDEDNRFELIGGWVMTVPPGDFETGESWGDLYSVLRPIVKTKRWSMSQDAGHRLPNPSNTVVYPDIAIHAVSHVGYIPGTRSVGRVPDLIVEFLSEKTHERDAAPRGAKFLAYQASGVREYYYGWSDGRGACGFGLRRGVCAPLRRDTDGFFHSPLLDHGLRLVEAAIRPL